MRVGEILICKKNYRDLKYSYYIVEYEKGEAYTINEIHNITHWYSPGKYKKHIKISYNIFKFENNGHHYGGDFIDERLNKSQVLDYEYIWDYFYTLKEWRKQKLQKINEQKSRL